MYSGNVSDDYGKLIDATMTEESTDICENHIFELLRDYYKEYDCKIIFFDKN